MKKRCVPLALGGILLFFFLVAAVFPAAFTSYGQKEMFAPWLTPSPAHLLGTNALGYDIFTELVYGTRQTLLIGVSSSVLTLVLGSVIGTLAAGKSVFGGVLNGVINIFCASAKAGDDDRTCHLPGQLQPESDPADRRIQLGGHCPERKSQGDPS